jgi:hypothetical protein
VFLVDVISLTRANCAQPMSFYTSLVVVLVGFKLVIVLLLASSWAWQRHTVYGSWRRVFVHVVTSLRPSRCRPTGMGMPMQRTTRPTRRRASVALALSAGLQALNGVAWAKVFKACFFLLFLAYPGVSVKILKVSA